MKRLFVLMVPGVLAAGIQQVNLVVGTTIAAKQDDANSWLYFADRIYQLPLGMIGIAFGVVLLPDITRKLRGGDEPGAIESISRGMDFAMLLTLPAAVAMAVIGAPIIGTIFEGGRFSAADTGPTAAALAGFALGLPGYVLIKVLQPGYFAREDTKRPMIMAGITVVVNIVISLALFPHFGHVGIAVATAISAWVNVFLLARGLRGFWRLDGALLAKIMRMLTASMTMGIALWSLYGLIDGWFDGGFLWKAIGLSLLVSVGGGVYFAAAIAMKATSISELKTGLRRS